MLLWRYSDSSSWNIAACHLPILTDRVSFYLIRRLQLRTQELSRDHFSMLTFWHKGANRHLRIILLKICILNIKFGWQEMSCPYITRKWLKIWSKPPLPFKLLFQFTGSCVSNWQIACHYGNSNVKPTPCTLKILYIFSFTKRVLILNLGGM